MSELLGVEVQFANDCMGEEAAVKAAALQPGEVLLLENLRFYAEEEGKPRGLAEDATDEEKAAAKKAVKESQKEFTKKLASYADCYVNDAFGTAHRSHASTALIAKYFDDFDFRRNFRTTHDSSERTFDVVQYFINGFHFFFHQVTEHLVVYIENLRFYAEEEGKPRGLAEDATDEEKAAAKKAVKESQKEFTKKLASYADCYVNDAFGTAHRAHASTALIAKYFDTNNKMFGYLMEKEVKAVDKVLNDIKRPFTAIMGGSKVSS